MSFQPRRLWSASRQDGTGHQTLEGGAAGGSPSPLPSFYNAEQRKFNGTVFRLPLRTASMAKRSLLSSTSHSAEEMCSLLDSFASAASEMVLFLNHVERIDLLVLPPGKQSRPLLIHRTRVVQLRQVAHMAAGGRNTK